MNKKILCVLPLSFLVVACGSQEAKVIAPGCVDRPAPPNQKCVSQGTTPFVNVTPNGWVVAPRNLCVTAGGTVEIRFLGATPPALNSMLAVPKGKPTLWLIGSNSSDAGKIVLSVPVGLETGDSFDYGILSENDGCVDPRFTVE